MLSWYRRFISNNATLATPLTCLLRNKQRWIWIQEQEIAFEKMRARLTEAPALSCPNFDFPFDLQTYASSTELGVVLAQKIYGLELDGHKVSDKNLATPGIDVINLQTNPNPSWYFRRFLAVTDFPEKLPNWRVVDNKLYHYLLNPVILTLVRDLKE